MVYIYKQWSQYALVPSNEIHIHNYFLFMVHGGDEDYLITFHLSPLEASKRWDTWPQGPLSRHALTPVNRSPCGCYNKHFSPDTWESRIHTLTVSQYVSEHIIKRTYHIYKRRPKETRKEWWQHLTKTLYQNLTERSKYGFFFSLKSSRTSERNQVFHKKVHNRIATIKVR